MTKFLSTILLLITLVFFCKNIKAQCHLDDWTALKALYENAGGINWTNQEAWDQVINDEPPSSCNLENLYGVAVNENGRVDVLSLGANNLEGTLPVELGNLIELTYLNLAENKLSGSIPKTLGSLDKLTILYLYKNQLSESIPNELGTLNNLIDLGLNTNQLSGSIPSELGDIVSLEAISLWENQLSGFIPEALGQLSNLKYLRLNENQLSGSIPSSLGGLDSLTIIYLNKNQLTGAIPTKIGALEQLEQLDLGSNQLSGTIPSALGKLKSIETLLVYENKLSGSLPAEIGDLTNLYFLNIGGNQLSGCYPENLMKLCNQLNDAYNINGYISSSNNFDISWEDFCEYGFDYCLVPKCNKDDWTALKALYENAGGINWTNQFGWEEVSNNEPTTTCNLQNLHGIKLNENGRVEHLKLYNNNLQGSIPAEIENLTELNILDLGFNGLTGYIPTEFTKLKNLGEIWLDDNQLSSNISGELGNLPNLKILSLYNNNFSNCFADNLSKLCAQLESEYNNNIYISFGNQFDITWEDFCQYGADYCLVPKCNINDWTALKALYENAGGINWTNQFAWEQVTSEEPPENCNLENLYGVVLNENGRVNVLNLSANNLVGTIPFELGNVSELSYLNLAENQLSGIIPATLGDLDSLTIMYLYDNQLSGQIPNTLGKLHNLIDFGLDRNQLSGNIPPELGDMANLKAMNLWENQLNGSIPKEIGNLDSLITLQLNQNQLTGSIPAALGNLSNLSGLSLHKNQLTGAIPIELAQLNQLKQLSLWDNLLTGEIPNELGDLTNLISLYLGHNKLTGEIPLELGKLKNLIDLGLDTNELTGEIPDSLGNMENLKALSLWENQLTGEIPESLGDLTEMKYLRLYANKLSGKIPSSLGQLSVLEELILSNNKLEDTIPESIGSLSNLTVLTLSQNRLQGNLPDEFNNLTQLEWFDISKNKLSGAIPKNIGTNKNLYADIRFNYFECEDMHNFKTDEADTYLNSPQCFIDKNIEDRIVIDSLTLASDTSVVLSMPYNSSNTLNYQWFKNGNLLIGETNPELMINNIDSTDAGKYKIRVENACEGITFFSDEIYVIIEGFDLNGQPVESNQIMVEFQNEAEKNRYARKFMNDGIYIDTLFNCNCNRELYLWEFNNTEDAVEALLTINKTVKKIKQKSKVSGGFNNLINIGEQADEDISYNVLPNTDNNQQYLDSVLIYIIDSGLDDENFDTTPITIAEAPKDDCHQIDAAPGYSYLDKDSLITNNYKDDLWHGTFGFRSIANGFPDDHNIKIVPLKVFNSKGEGSLFKLVCALYHAIDNGADIINLSAGYQGQSSDILENAINAAREKGIFIVTAAGNDGINMNKKDATPQYPANFASEYHYFFDTMPRIKIKGLVDKSMLIGLPIDTMSQSSQDKDTSILNGLPKLDSIIYDNVISVASINNDGEMSVFSNYGKESATLAAYGEKINTRISETMDIVASGTSMATYFVTSALALEIATNNKRTYKEAWENFVNNCLIDNNALKDYTRTGKQLNARLVEVVDKCNQADWSALKALYFNTNGNNWKNKNGWEIVTKDSISGDCNLEILFGVELNEYGRVANINLYNNNLSGSIPKEIEQLTKLEGLYLAANYLSGNIPYQLGSLTKLKNLILSANNLSGSVPIQLSNLSNLERLYLSYNQLTGAISLPFHNLSSLKYFLINNNKLTGSMPVGLAQLNKLIVLAINHNQFTGCYKDELKVLCKQLQFAQIGGNTNISDGNNFDTAWENFCATNEGVCIDEKNTPFGHNENIKVYPNPSEGYITIQFLKNKQYEVLNISNLAGKQMLQRDIKNLTDRAIELDLTQLSKGMYVIEVQSAAKKITQKFILK